MPTTPPGESQIEALIHDLSRAEVAEDAFNEYAPGDVNNARRRDNLRRYLQVMAARKPATLLVLEAPGYRGCRLTGVPVTSRKILLEGAPALRIFGADAGFSDVTDAGFERVYGEQSATILWGTLADLGTLPFIWNTFPFHPHKREQPLSNRKPRSVEIKLGTLFLRRIMQEWQFEQVIAVGNVAHQTLQAEGFVCAQSAAPGPRRQERVCRRLEGAAFSRRLRGKGVGNDFVRR